MALIQPITDARGVTASYWKISTIRPDFLSRTGRIEMAGYVDEGQRAEAHRRGVLQRIDIPVPEEEFEDLYEAIVSEQDNLLTLCYDYVKSYERTKTRRRRDPQTQEFVEEETTYAPFDGAEDHHEDLA
jgi:hypothetical protein